jgi:glutaminyl-peptide cyclotransferase
VRTRVQLISACAALLLSAVVTNCGPRAAVSNASELSEAPQTGPVTPRFCSYEVEKEFPHDASAFTQGLLYEDGVLFESTGLVGQSSIRRVRLSDGKVLQQVAVPPPFFGEGLTKWKNELISLTWQHGKAFRWDVQSLRKIGELAYEAEGWGLTDDGKSLILSDGTPVLRFLNPATGTVERTVTVTAGGEPVSQLNELEWVSGEIFANVWMTDQIVRIDPKSGAVTSVVDLTGLRERAGATGTDVVLNGIAYDPGMKRLFVTGKNWPKLYQIALRGC